MIGHGPFRYVYLIGPEANYHLMAGNPGNFRWREAFDVLVPIGGETALIVSDGLVHKRRRRLVQPAFHKKRLDAYLGFMVDYTNDTINSWRPGQRVDVYRELRATIRRIVIRSLFGAHLTQQADWLGANLQVMLDFVNLLPALQIKLNLPGAPWHKTLSARRAIDDLIYSEIRRRRAAPDEADDVMALLLETRDEDGDFLSDVEVRDQVVSLITAGFDTTSAAVGWAVYAMLRDPHIWARACAECERVVGNRVPTVGDLSQLTYLDWVISETLRLYSPAVLGVRKAIEAFEFGGYTIPAGSRVVYSQYVTHRLPEIWPDPEAFIPERWDPAAPGYRVPTPYEYVPFGGGARRCLGAPFALMEMKAILTQLLCRTRLSLLPQTITPTGLAAMYPKEGISVEVAQV